MLCFMRNEFTAIIERDGEWFVGWSPEIPGANGQGRGVEACRTNLGSAIGLVPEDREDKAEQTRHRPAGDCEAEGVDPANAIPSALLRREARQPALLLPLRPAL
jgi:predicted RNase H-like HicB family nuclease